MSDVMLLGVLRMPHELAMADDLSRSQCWSRAAEAADRIEADAERVAALQSRLARYEQPDDAELVDIRWLEKLELPCRGAIAVRLCDDGFHLMVSGRPSEGIAGLNDWVCPHVATRGQVRRLIQALRGEP